MYTVRLTLLSIHRLLCTYRYESKPQVSSSVDAMIALHCRNEVRSGLPSKRINLSPFTKDFRGGGQFYEFDIICFRPSQGATNDEGYNNSPFPLHTSWYVYVWTTHSVLLILIHIYSTV